MVYHEKILVTSKNNVEMIRITGHVKKAVEASNIKNGLVSVVTAHTTTGITVNEGLECLEYDITALLKRLVPEEYPYEHARFLKDYGRTSANATGHLRGMLLGNSCQFHIESGKLLFGAAQEIYLAELDGPQERGIFVAVIGE